MLFSSGWNSHVSEIFQRHQTNGIYVREKLFTSASELRFLHIEARAAAKIFQMRQKRKQGFERLHLHSYVVEFLTGWPWCFKKLCKAYLRQNMFRIIENEIIISAQHFVSAAFHKYSAKYHALTALRGKFKYNATFKRGLFHSSCFSPPSNRPCVSLQGTFFSNLSNISSFKQLSRCIETNISRICIIRCCFRLSWRVEVRLVTSMSTTTVVACHFWTNGTTKKADMTRIRWLRLPSILRSRCNQATIIKTGFLLFRSVLM